MSEPYQTLYLIPTANGDYGPYTASQLKEFVNEGKVSRSTMAKYADTGDPVSVDVILVGMDLLPEDSYSPKPRANGPGKASFVLSIISAFFHLIWFIITVNAVANRAILSLEDTQLIGLMVILGGLAGLVSLILGIVGLGQANAKKGLAAAGTIISAILTLFIIVVMIMGNTR